ncbi:MAG: nucleotidyltransferase domain-containing protein [Limnochordaceae bacterium]|uniref:Nucleotidyltransferase domain-containing protein n=1 Tax=Carboxydichorda subterranea TaxID=3109565 RepID=A0ABZ1BUM1_9FIRM|nr:nucleotidyltransferase domain-containing protein [Limnochorda sp. L945t]MBE3597279.1 nucleotidyltransferase domain-containing protein [Limnochordaceae bacterium]WRP16320.1 nucleotidyltransferase domain-containing protein [Limnochorda sp. L945t]
MNGAATVHPALRRRIEEQERLLEVARHYACKLAETLAVRWAVVAGSVARGDFHDGSDIDVLVVSDALPSEPLRRAKVLFEVAEGGVEPKGLTLAEVKREIHRRNPLVLEALASGMVVYPQGTSLDEFRRDVGAPSADDA